MKALVWHGKNSVSVDNVADPEIINPHDAVIKVSLTAICGSDLHLYDGCIPSMREGDILGHEFMGEVVEIGNEVKNLRIGDRVVVPFPIACGSCHFCHDDLFSLCDNSNPNAWMAEKLFGYSPAGLFGYSHMLGGYAGGQAEYVRVPFADVGPIKVPDSLSDEKVLFLSDIFPTGYMAAEACDIKEGDSVAIWGAGPVGQFALKSALMLGAEMVIVIDREKSRLDLAAKQSDKVVTIDYSDENVLECIDQLTSGMGADACIDAVGLEAHGTGVLGAYDRAKFRLSMQTDIPSVLRESILACRKGGVVSISGVYGGYADKIPVGAAFNKALTLKMGQTHVQRYLPKLLEYVESEQIDPSFVISHRMALADAPLAYELFKNKEDGCSKVVLHT